VVYFTSGGIYAGLGGTLVGVVFMFMPWWPRSIVQKLVYKQPVRGPLGVNFDINRWWFVAWLLPPVLALVTLAVSLLLPGVHFSIGMEDMYARYAANLTPAQLEEMRRQTAQLPVHPFWLTLGQGLLAGLTINAVAGFGEELGGAACCKAKLATSASAQCPR